MSGIEFLLNQPWIARAGWALLHFLWQGTLIALLLATVRGLAGESLTARSRYLLACAALGIMTTLPLLTFVAADSAAVVIAPSWRPDSGTLERALPWVVVVWLCGATLFSLRLIGACRFTKVLRTVAVSPASREWQRAFDQMARRIGVSRPVRVLVSSVAEVPMVIGWLRPVVLMPLSALTGMPPDQVESLLAHELAHIFRNDYLVNLLQSIAEAVLFYHPAVWWVSEQIRIERELCCDDIAVAATGDVSVYVRALSGLETRRRARMTAALAADGASLVSRVRRLIAEPRPAARNLPAAGAAWVLSLVWLAAVGAATVLGAPGPMRNVPAQPAMQAPAPAPLMRTLLFDPVLDLPTRNQLQKVWGKRAAELQFVSLSEAETASAFETWVEGESSDSQRISAEVTRVMREPGKTTLLRSILDHKRHISVVYEATVQTLAETGAYRVTLRDPSPATSAWVRSVPGSRTVSPATFPVPQILRGGDTLALNLFSDNQTGQNLIDYIHVGERNRIAPRTEAARDATREDGNAEFKIVQPRLSANGVARESLPETFRGSVVWVYVPGLGRVFLSFQPNPDLGFDGTGEVSGNSLTFAVAGHIFRIEAAERIVAAGPGMYRIHALLDSAWQPADSANRNHFEIGSVPDFDTGRATKKDGPFFMRAMTISTGVLAFALNAAFGQEQPAQVQTKFEVAAVRQEGPTPGPPIRGISGGPGSPDPTRISYSSVSMLGLMTLAYDLPMDQISGPSWISTERFSIEAKVPPGATREQLHGMLQNLLAERFNLTAHLEKKEIEAYAMTVAKGGLKMKESAIDPNASTLPLDRDAIIRAAQTPLTFKDGFPVLAPGNTPASWGIGVNGRTLYSARQQDMAWIVRTFQSALSVENRGAAVRVVDRTGLTGKYDLHLQFAREIPTGAAAANANNPPGSDYLDSIGEPTPDVITAAQQQLGLHLEKTKVPLDVLVIDRVDKMPTAN